MVGLCLYNETRRHSGTIATDDIDTYEISRSLRHVLPLELVKLHNGGLVRGKELVVVHAIERLVPAQTRVQHHARLQSEEFVLISTFESTKAGASRRACAVAIRDMGRRLFIFYVVCKTSCRLLILYLSLNSRGTSTIYCESGPVKCGRERFYP